MERTSSIELNTTNQTVNAEIENEGSVQSELVLERLRPLIKSLSALSEGLPDFREDFVSEGVLAVLTAANRFKPEQGELEHYAARLQKGCLLNNRRWLRDLYAEVAVERLSTVGQYQRYIWGKAKYERAVNFNPQARLLQRNSERRDSHLGRNFRRL